MGALEILFIIIIIISSSSSSIITSLPRPRTDSSHADRKVNVHATNNTAINQTGALI